MVSLNLTFRKRTQPHRVGDAVILCCLLKMGPGSLRSHSLQLICTDPGETLFWAFLKLHSQFRLPSLQVSSYLHKLEVLRGEVLSLWHRLHFANAKQIVSHFQLQPLLQHWARCYQVFGFIFKEAKWRLEACKHQIYFGLEPNLFGGYA